MGDISTYPGAAPPVPQRTQPRFEFVRQQIFDEISSGRWPAGRQIPGECELARSFGVSVGTVRRALGELVQEGLLSRRRKTGTVVTGRGPSHSLRFFYDYFRLHSAEGRLQRSQAVPLSLDIVAGTAPECASLALPAGSRLYRYHRLRAVAGRPVMHDLCLMPVARLPGFPTRLQDIPELLCHFLADRYGLRTAAVREEVTARLADDEDARLLRLTPPAAILEIRAISYDSGSRPLLSIHHRATTEGQKYINELF
jgi:GntR family transcriptional regulator